MAAHLTVTAYLPDELIATLRTLVDRSNKGDSIQAIAKQLLAVAGPAKRGMIRACIASEVASKVVNCDQSDAVDGTDELVIGGVTLAVEAAPANEDQFAKGSTDAEFAANTVAAINAHSVLKKIVWAAVTGSASGNITIYALVPGPIGNHIALSEAGNGFEIAGGATALSGGASDEVDAYECGYSDILHVAG